MTVALGLTKFQDLDNYSTPVAVTLTGTTVAGSTIVVIIAWQRPASTIDADPTITGGGLTWTKRLNPSHGGTNNSVGAVQYEAINVAAQTNLAVTVTIATSGDYANCTIAELQNVDTTAPIDGSNSGSAGTTTNPTMLSGSASNSTTDAIAIAFATLDSGSNPSITSNPPTGFTTISFEGNQTAHQGVQVSYKILSSATSTSASWSTTSSGGDGCWAAGIAIYKGAAAVANVLQPWQQKGAMGAMVSM